MEANEVGSEHPAQHPVPLRQRPEQFFRGKRNMKEEADAGVRQPAAQELREKQELVVVNPDEIAGLVVLGDHFRELFIDFHVRLPVTHVERHLIEQIVK
jgi:hypothetical protein